MGERGKVMIAAAVAALGLAGLAPAAGARTTPLTLPGDLRITLPDYQGEDFPDAIAVVNAGDVNGDGREDLAVRGDQTGDVEVIYTDPAGLLTDYSALGPGRGFVIHSEHGAIDGIAPVGDTNGDGRADVAVDAGGDKVTVVYGRADGRSVDLDALGTDGYVIAREPMISDWSIPTGADPSITGVGDVDGDGRGDVVLAAVPWGAGLVRSPAAPGTTVSVDDGTHGRPIQLDPFVHSLRLADLGDLDGDGRDEVLIAGHTGGEPLSDRTVTAWGLSLAGDGPIDATQAPALGRGFVLTSEADDVDSALSVADVDGDGRRDIGLGLGTGFVVVPTPPFGATVDLDAPGAATRVGIGGGPVVDLGDQDGDGRDELAVRRNVAFSDPARRGAESDSGFGAALAPSDGAFTGALGDLDADGRREPIVLVTHLSPFGPPYARTAEIDAFSSRRLVPPAPSLQAPPAVVQPGPRPSVTPATRPGPTVTPVKRRHGVHRHGTRHADHLRGTPYADVLDGRGGKDVLQGLGGNDRLDGGSGNDRLLGGPGKDHLVGGSGKDRLDGGSGNDVISARDGRRDVVRCGPGRDSATVDRTDDVRGCERVHRPRRHRRH
jgi:hypothetical protein